MRAAGVTGQLSRREIARRTHSISRGSARSVLLFYGSLEDFDVLEQSVFGRKYRVLSRGQHENKVTGDIIQGDGRLKVEDISGNIEGRENALKPGGQKRTIHDADAVASKLIEICQGRGLVQLTGNVDEDREIMRQATATWISWRRTAAKKLVAQHYQNNQKASANPATSHLVEEMSELTAAAQRFLELDKAGRYDSFFKAKARYAFQCREENCGRGENDSKLFQLHLTETHKLSDAEIVAKYAPDTEEDDDIAEVAPARQKDKKPSAPKRR